MPAPTYTPVLKLGLLGTISNLLSKEDTVSRCSVCAALVDVPATHTTWHADQDAAIAAAAKAGSDAATAAGKAQSAASGAQKRADDAYAHASDAMFAATTADSSVLTVSDTAAQALDTAIRALTNMCPVCKLRVRAFNMAAHLAFHESRSMSDPVETPTAVQTAASGGASV